MRTGVIFALQAAITISAAPFNPAINSQGPSNDNLSKRTTSDRTPIDILTLPHCEKSFNIRIRDQALKLAIRGEGLEGCVYDITGGWNGKPAVAKTTRVEGARFLSREITALQRLGELYATGWSKDRQWLIMHKWAGVRITETKRWKEFFGHLDSSGQWVTEYLSDEMKRKPGGFGECYDFMSDSYRLYAGEIQRLAQKYNMHHLDNHWRNVLVEESKEKEVVRDTKGVAILGEDGRPKKEYVWTSFHVIDWSEWIELDPSNGVDFGKEEFDEVFSLLAEEQQLPIEDAKHRRFQGICDSNRREANGWQSPWWTVSEAQTILSQMAHSR